MQTDFKRISYRKVLTQEDLPARDCGPSDKSLNASGTRGFVTEFNINKQNNNLTTGFGSLPDNNLLHQVLRS